MVSNHVTVHIHTYMHTTWQPCTHTNSYTPVMLILIDCMAPRVSLPTPKNENGVNGWGLYALCTDSACRQSHTHTQPTPRQLRAQQTAEGWRLFLPCWCCRHILHWLSVGCTHTHKQYRQCAVFLSIPSLSVPLSHSHGLCICVRLWKHVLYKLYSVCVCMLYVSRRTVVPVESYPLAFTIFSKAVAPQAHAATKVCDLDAIFCASWALSSEKKIIIFFFCLSFKCQVLKK